MVSVAERLRTNSDTLLIVFDLVGTLVFALEGAMRAIRGDLDFLGLLVLAFVTAVGGGIIRDLLIGATPPSAIRDWRYFGIAILGATSVFFSYQWVQMAVVMGGITGVGGGTVRDLLLAQVPSVLRKDVYASAALAGGVVMVLLLKVKVPRAVAMLAGGSACFLLRMVSVARHWNLPRLLHHY
jgi:uncharacterized membrane protein YeiH